jgi:hypothetical protein
MMSGDPHVSGIEHPSSPEPQDLVATPYVGGAPVAWTEEEEMIQRIGEMPREVGWLLIYVGVLGVILPGIIGIPFLVAGGAIVSPGGPKRLARWVGRKPPGLVRAGMKQITRLTDDLDRRYPLLPKAGARQK